LFFQQTTIRYLFVYAANYKKNSPWGKQGLLRFSFFR